MGTSYTYDAIGNRILRKQDLICIDCPRPGTIKSQLDTSINNLLSNKDVTSVFAFPNPTNNFLYIENPSWVDNSKIMLVVTDVLGKVITRLNFSERNFTVPLSHLLPGNYFVHYYLNSYLLQTWHIVKL